MSSTGSSLVRARSLRKPTPGSATDLSQKPATATASSTTSTSTLPAASRGLSPSRLPSLRSARPPIASSTQPSNVAQPALKKTRPLPGLARSGSVTSRPPPKPQDPAAQAPPPAASRRYPPNASASASANTAVRRPTSSGGLPPPAQGPPAGARVLGHARAKSTTTASLGAAATSRTISSAAPVLRPPSQTSTTAPKQRPVSIHNRPPSASDRPVPPKPTTTTTRTASTTRPAPPTQPSQDLTRDAPRLRPKPAFSTHQQHFSPLRRPGPKTLTAAYLAPPSPSKLPSNVASSAETARLQTNLLQLHLLHRDAAPTIAAWHASARKTLNTRHTTLASRSEGLSALEARRAENTDTQALLAWGASHGGLDTSLNALDPLITGLWALHAPAGRCARLARHFSRWCDRLSDAEAARTQLSSSPIVDDESALLAGPIDAEWREQAAHLARRLEGWGRQLRDLRCREDVDANASIRRALEGCSALVTDTLAEIAVMEDIVRLAGARERDWIRRMNREDDGGSARREDTPRAGAVWRSF